MAVIGGFRSDLSITRKIDLPQVDLFFVVDLFMTEILETFQRVFCFFSKSCINENGGKTSIFFHEASLLGQIFVLRTANFRGATTSQQFFDRNTLLFKSVETRYLTN